MASLVLSGTQFYYDIRDLAAAYQSDKIIPCKKEIIFRTTVVATKAIEILSELFTGSTATEVSIVSILARMGINAVSREKFEMWNDSSIFLTVLQSGCTILEKPCERIDFQAGVIEALMKEINRLNMTQITVNTPRCFMRSYLEPTIFLLKNVKALQVGARVATSIFQNVKKFWSAKSQDIEKKVKSKPVSDNDREIQSLFAKDALFEEYTCPITHSPIRYILKDPTSDKCFEAEVLVKWVKIHFNSPLTRKFLTLDKLIECPEIQQKIDERIKTYAKVVSDAIEETKSQ